MNQPDIIIEEIAIALQTGGMLSFFDREEKVVIVLHEDSDDDLFEEEINARKLVEAFPERFQLIKPLPKWKNFNIREAFIRTVEDQEVADRLRAALKIPRPFANFRRVLNYFPDYLMKWYLFEENYFLKAAKQWMDYFEVNE